MNATAIADVDRALALVPGVWAILTAEHEGKRAGVVITRLIRCADEPPCIAVALRKGHRISTIIRDSHCFAACLVDRSQRLLLRRFEARSEPGLVGGGGTETFETLGVRTLATGAPVLTQAMAALDCEVMRHFDLEADHEFYVGQIVGACVLNPAPAAGERSQRHDAELRPGERRPSAAEPGSAAYRGW